MGEAAPKQKEPVRLRLLLSKKHSRRFANKGESIYFLNNALDFLLWTILLATTSFPLYGTLGGERGT